MLFFLVYEVDKNKKMDNGYFRDGKNLGTPEIFCMGVWAGVTMSPSWPGPKGPAEKI